MSAVRRILVCALLAGCSAEPVDVGKTARLLSPEVELERVTAIRDVSAGEGLTNGPLLAGIAESETGLVHCWSEATWACQGPASPSCDGGPVIAGAADGPCSARQGGLGMFQFDAGTYEETLARDGEDILLVEGNIAKAVEFVVTRVIQDIPSATDEASALAWLNSIPMRAGDPLMEEYAAFIVCRYNGCCSDSSTCISRRNKYRDNAIHYYEKYGAEFWNADAPGCEPVPPEGRVIDETDICYLRGGDPQYWRRVDDGFDGGQDWTMATDLDSAANYGIWRLDFDSAGTYVVEVHLDGGATGQSRQALYQIVHNGVTDEVLIDQTAAEGWVVLGEFDFAPGDRQHVQLGDNTGEPTATMKQLAFDAVRVTPLEGGDVAVSGCACDASSKRSGAPPPALALFGLVLAAALRRRSARR